MKTNDLCFIGAVVPPSLIVLISLRSIPGYLALSGLFNGGLFSRAKPVPGICFKTLIILVSLPHKPDLSGCSRFFIGAGTGVGLPNPIGTVIAFLKHYKLEAQHSLRLFLAHFAVKPPFMAKLSFLCVSSQFSPWLKQYAPNFAFFAPYLRALCD
ncbi:hypothetical protein OQX63_20630 [Pedobacter sp. PF22-3]|uniref:hypothetical protein n=1 Tax=Pedobacter sp. PF22-3 TaxID=2994467 RepID=UPI002246D410|nr:hypothetical protein [Pedobacter sp. PF22-3]MCX2495913.1 hypothetical protein [Pedobacter sp. PF22-3]